MYLANPRNRRYARPVNRTLLELRAHLGRPARFHIDAEPARKRTAVIATVIWDCGCRAAGPGLTRLDLRPCAAHRSAAGERRGRVPILGLLTRT